MARSDTQRDRSRSITAKAATMIRRQARRSKSVATQRPLPGTRAFLALAFGEC